MGCKQRERQTQILNKRRGEIKGAVLINLCVLSTNWVLDLKNKQTNVDNC